jgi:hypothetical protein
MALKVIARHGLIVRIRRLSAILGSFNAAFRCIREKTVLYANSCIYKKERSRERNELHRPLTEAPDSKL